MQQTQLFSEKKIVLQDKVVPFKTQFLKWVGNKQRFAHEIISYFPDNFKNYYEPFIGSGAVLGTLAPKKGFAGDLLKPLAELWDTLSKNPQIVIDWYKSNFQLIDEFGKIKAFEKIRDSYNQNPNPKDLLFISRSCYGGVLRFRKADGAISTPCGVHDPISPLSFEMRANLWNNRIKNVEVYHADFEVLFDQAKRGDVIYCDPPYVHSQTILYGAQSFSLERLFTAIEKATSKGIFILLSIDGTKKSGLEVCDIEIPKKLFKRCEYVNCGRSMLRRFQLKDKTLESEVVSDRLLLNW
ncbi:MAG: DNA methyltransferase [Deltaproteobacteria bacterium CG11_big_fil_rev_8_21_14_0_20_42_23]|nr:MAG: DNA methyltransferase [Deltaproteobacteria bacterium CG11_big_fil_rev_8_21_14_0_20_42_23]PJC64490.1 MAG: DNA methyltransferase [Deltaproteobacteria bacterium CG_4_9_14_0_2_um_filter_42_21]